MSKILRWVLPLVAMALVATRASASTILCLETNTGGCIAPIPTSSPALLVASDGEDSFKPFGISVDVSDAIQLNSNWAPNAASSDSNAFATGFWTQLLGPTGAPTYTWVLPSSTPCGSENEPGCEPVASWYFPHASWGSATPSDLIILDADGVTVSDEIFVNNGGPEGSAQIIFHSDPNVGAAVPEPASLTLLGLGLAAAAGRLRRKSA